MKILLTLIAALAVHVPLSAQTFMMNPYGSAGATSLNGKWNAIIDPFDLGIRLKKFYQNRKPATKSEFVEYSFENGLRLDVPGDFNSQDPQLKYYEGNVWYQRDFEAQKNPGHRHFLYFAGVSYEATVWLNGKPVGHHEGGFTPFQFDITDLLQSGKNNLVIRVNNARRVDGIPAMDFDWWNYGGILRDVFLVERPTVHIHDYRVQLAKGKDDTLSGHIQLAGAKEPAEVQLEIAELGIRQTLRTDQTGRVDFSIPAKPERWSPENPKLYAVSLSTGGDRISDRIGFRNIEVQGTSILLNGKKIFLKGVNFHEEIPQREGRAYSDADAAMIISEVKALGCNFIRTAHYPQNERIVRKAEEAGLMIWSEIPLWQGIEFTNPAILKKAETMLEEMVYRDKNRAGVIIWSIANETKPTEYRDRVLTELVQHTHQLDDTRLVGAAFHNGKFDPKAGAFVLNDKLSEVVDVVGINEYYGWYEPFPVDPAQMQWQVATTKPVIMSEFGAEAMYGERGPVDVANLWSEDYQAAVFRQDLLAFANIPNLAGTSPWILFDFRSPRRMHQTYQNGWNRKGLLSDKGQRKQAWWVMKEFYETR